MEGKYFFNGKDISMNLYIQIRDVVDIIMEKSHFSFPGSLGKFLSLKTFKALPNKKNTLLGGICWLFGGPFLGRRKSTNNQITKEKYV